ncbi:hypothetical protein CORC01_03088 [Colletotrichum orchidophilum]|uniref:Uncharacterized protein n=1 Tax=Colletotrichum orchidophilum TaxID=1209926 RepID=A0A1G4BJX4_9PEZI|nr:uncharacterized protein CORC01_03088 [Colletotrichum orchidophilum]OHF01598.1 hypothetical protein CORC01_03088 [Colletotrichum orchidophilum]
MTKLEIRRVDCDATFAKHRPVGAFKLRKIPPRVDAIVRGVKFKMARKHPLSSTLSFRFLGVREMRWEVLGKHGKGMRLVDFNGKTRAFFRSRLHVMNAGLGSGGGGRGGREGGEDGNSPPPASHTNMMSQAGWGPGFELHAALADLDLDLVVTTGLAAAEYHRQLDEDWDLVLEKAEAARETQELDKGRDG